MKSPNQTTVLDKLRSFGFRVRPEGVEGEYEEAYNKLLAMDFRKSKILDPFFDSDLNTADNRVIYGPVVLQIVSVANISQPSRRQHEESGNRVLVVKMTDGHMSVYGVEKEHCSQLSLKLAPGSKILLQGEIRVCLGKLLLVNSNVKVVGGCVQHLLEAWQTNRHTQQHRANKKKQDGPTAPPSFELNIQRGTGQQGKTVKKSGAYDPQEPSQMGPGGDSNRGMSKKKSEKDSKGADKKKSEGDGRDPIQNDSKGPSKKKPELHDGSGNPQNNKGGSHGTHKKAGRGHDSRGTQRKSGEDKGMDISRKTTSGAHDSKGSSQEVSGRAVDNRKHSQKKSGGYDERGGTQNHSEAGKSRGQPNKKSGGRGTQGRGHTSSSGRGRGRGGHERPFPPPPNKTKVRGDKTTTSSGRAPPTTFMSSLIPPLPPSSK